MCTCGMGRLYAMCSTKALFWHGIQNQITDLCMSVHALGLEGGASTYLCAKQQRR